MKIYSLEEYVWITAPVHSPSAFVIDSSMLVLLNRKTWSLESETHYKWKWTLYPPKLPPKPLITLTEPSKHFDPQLCVVEFRFPFLSNKYEVITLI